MFYEIEDKLINLDKIVVLEKDNNNHYSGFSLILHFGGEFGEVIEFNSLLELETEYTKIKERLKEIYG